MSIKQTSAVLLACIISLIFHPIHATTTFNNGLWTPDAVASATPAPIAGIPNKVVATTAAPAQPLTTAAPAAPASVCTPYQCNLFYQWVSVYYWPQKGANTQCLAGAPRPTGLPPAGPKPKSPSATVVFPSITANDGCSQIGKTYAAQTTSFAPGQLSSIEANGATKVFNFADLPCGPPGYTGPQPYAPLIAPPKFLFDMDPEWANCIPALHQGVDPPFAVSEGDGPNGPNLPPRKRQLDDLLGRHPHMKPQDPE